MVVFLKRSQENNKIELIGLLITKCLAIRWLIFNLFFIMTNSGETLILLVFCTSKLHSFILYCIFVSIHQKFMFY